MAYRGADNASRTRLLAVEAELAALDLELQELELKAVRATALRTERDDLRRLLRVPGAGKSLPTKDSRRLARVIALATLGAIAAALVFRANVRPLITPPASGSPLPTARMPEPSTSNDGIAIAPGGQVQVNPDDLPAVLRFADGGHKVACHMLDGTRVSSCQPGDSLCSCQ